MCEDEVSEWWTYLLNAFICSQRRVVHVCSRPPASRCRSSFLRKSLNSLAPRLPPSVRRFSCALCGQTACIYSTSCHVTATFQHGDKERSVGFLCRVFGPFCHETHKVKWQQCASVCSCCFLPGCIVLSSFFNPIVKLSHFSPTQVKRFIFFFFYIQTFHFVWLEVNTHPHVSSTDCTNCSID